MYAQSLQQLASKVDSQGFLNQAQDSETIERKNSCQESSRFQFEPIEQTQSDSQMDNEHQIVCKSGDNSPVKQRLGNTEVIDHKTEASYTQQEASSGSLD